MSDEETGSWWQQVTGEAIQGPLKGKRLIPVAQDEITFSTWKREHKTGRALRPDAQVSKLYEPADWEIKYAKLPVVTKHNKEDKLPPRTLIAGVDLDGISKAYPVDSLKQQRLILDSIGSIPVFIVLGDDNKSVRAFDRRIDNRELELFVKVPPNQSQNKQSFLMVDSESGSVWDFSGKAIDGLMKGKQLKKIPILMDYWFDWKIYHPKTAVYNLK